MLHLSDITISPIIDEKITRICILSETLEHIPIPEALALKVFHKQYVKSSLFSAKIEGNVLSFNEISPVDIENPRTISKKEIANLVRTLQRLHQWKDQLTHIQLQEIHAEIMKGISGDAGRFRHEQTAIFDTLGNAIYLTPNEETMRAMLDEFFFSWNACAERKQCLVQIASYHLFFEKIHPFLDGNGRVGRVLIHLLLLKFHLVQRMTVLPIEEYIEMHRDSYYYYLEQGEKTISQFVEFILDSIIWGFERTLLDIKNESDVISHQHSLLPRRDEILQIITDHPFCTLDFLSRRFLTIPRRTLSYDVQWLVKHSYVQKHGNTKGVSYSIVS